MSKKLKTPKTPQDKLKQWFQTVKFRKALIGGVDERDVWKKLEELNRLYEEALVAERARYDALLKQATGGVPTE